MCLTEKEIIKYANLLETSNLISISSDPETASLHFHINGTNKKTPCIKCLNTLSSILINKEHYNIEKRYNEEVINELNIIDDLLDYISEKTEYHFFKGKQQYRCRMYDRLTT